MSNWIKKGSAVVSIINLDVVMTVEDFKYKTGTILDKDLQEVTKKFLIGVVCSYYEGEVHMHEPFHSKNLIPYEVVQKGKTEAIAFFNREGKYKDI